MRWVTATWGPVRAGVVVASAVAAVGVGLLGALDGLETDPMLWVGVTGCAVAGALGSVRAAAVPVVPVGSRLATMEAQDEAAAEQSSKWITRATLRDGGWSLLIVVGVFAVRSLVLLALGGDPIQLLLIPLVALVWFTAYIGGWVLGLLLVLAIGSAVRLALAARRGHRVAPEWWGVPTVFLAILVFAVSALLSVTLLGAPSSRGLGGFLALVVWDFHDLDGWELVVAWTTRLSGLAIVVSIVALAAGASLRRRRRADGEPEDAAPQRSRSVRRR